MRDAFVKAITNLASQDRRVVLLMADIGYTIFDDFKRYFPSRFYNCGVAEQNMTGVAAGMALGGLRPFTFTIAAFNTARCYEQIKIDVGTQNLPVVIVGSGGGETYADQGPTHTALDDIALMELVPNMTILCPQNGREVHEMMQDLPEGPAYLRLVWGSHANV